MFYEREIEKVMEFKVEVDENMYGVSKCPYRTYEDIYLGGYFCRKMCKYHRGVDEQNRIVKCDFPVDDLMVGLNIGKHPSLYNLAEMNFSVICSTSEK